MRKNIKQILVAVFAITVIVILIFPRNATSKATTQRPSGEVMEPEQVIEQEIDLLEELSKKTGYDKSFIEKIISCESSQKQSAVNNNLRADSTVWSRDWGLFQINDYYWDKKARELGYDYKNNEEDNIKMAFYIMENQGISAWKASRHCWGA